MPGGGLHPRNVSREFKGMLVEADLPTIRFHDLRHTAATSAYYRIVARTGVTSQTGPYTLAIE